MRKFVSILLFLLLFVSTSVATCLAGPRFHHPTYGRSFHHGPPIPYRHHSGRYSNPGYILAPLGISLLTGVIIGSIINQPPKPRTVVYTTPTPVVIPTKPVVNRQYYNQSNRTSELVLRQVKTTAGLLNIRFGPGLDTNITNQVERGTVLDVIGAAPEWLYIRTPSGQYGWVMSQYTIEAQGPVG